MGDVQDALLNLERFKNSNLTKRIAGLEQLLAGNNINGVKKELGKEGITQSLLHAALVVKKASSQIDVVVHALGIMTALPYILKQDEHVESLSLGAGSTGKAFDLETNMRIAEFKFIKWQGGSESIRQNQLFKDLFSLAAYETTKERQLFLTGVEIPLRFLATSNRSIKSALSKNDAVKESFYAAYGDKYKTVSQYYHDVRSKVEIVDLSKLLPDVPFYES